MAWCLPTEWASADVVLRGADVVVLSLEDVGRDRERLEHRISGRHGCWF